MACGHRLAERVSHAPVTNRYQRRARRRLKNFSRNRPETTNLNHQYAIRRVDICRILDAPSGAGSWIAPKPEAGCDMVHIGGRKRRRDGSGKFALIPHPIAIDIAICAVTALAATATMTDYTGKDISGETITVISGLQPSFLCDDRHPQSLQAMIGRLKKEMAMGRGFGSLLAAAALAGVLAFNSGAGAQTAATPADNTVPTPDNAVMLTIFLKHDQSRPLSELNAQLEKQGFYRAFPPPGIEVVSWYVMMGIGQVVTLRLPASRLREVNRILEDKAWGSYRTEFYPTYDYKAIGIAAHDKAQ
jgi:hypothetical protein